MPLLLLFFYLKWSWGKSNLVEERSARGKRSLARKLTAVQCKGFSV
ncbi:hypothetical protein MMB68_09435 [Priestia sp. Y58]|nr:hypothetical protein [Priestia sp. Y58]MDG0029786.1 hypothetical protein [Priestia sp. Y58]